ncbi:MAG: DNA-directed RNA polymerase subunit beta', partial [Firmicutes bacterium]|nr:DNA-directed RNA polymerase subunit beta' [Bacillota bacterium]
VLDEIIKDHPVLLNRAPTLHRLGIQAFEPVLVEGKAIKLHPLVCTAYNADFDGDQMAVHVPLSVEAQAEARFLMLSVNNILAPKDGSPITTPTQDMILGSYYLTYPGTCVKVREDGTEDHAIDEFEDVVPFERRTGENGEEWFWEDPKEKDPEKKVLTVALTAEEAADGSLKTKLLSPTEVKSRRDGFVRVPEKGDGKVFCDEAEMLMAYQTGAIGIHARVKVMMSDGERQQLVESTVGRFIFNEEIPQDLGYITDRDERPFSMEICRLVKKKDLTDIIDRCFRRHGNTETVKMMDHIKDTGFKYSTKAAITISIGDMLMPPQKAQIIAAAQAKVDKYQAAYRRGLMSNAERYEKVIEIWHQATDDVADALMNCLPADNNLKIMADSGARGSKNQIRQIGGMRGLMANATGKTIEVPITANFREGLSVMEYFLSSNGARKGLADTALRTADSGYLTRRLVDVSHNVIVRENDCGTNEGIEVRAFTDGKETIEALRLRISGRTALEDVIDPASGEVLVEAGEEISDDQAEAIEKAGIETVKIRSVMTCGCEHGVCAKCYGRNLATGEHVTIGEAVGIIAAQSIGEPGTQLTMRTFHSGGISVAGNDITQGLPRVEELFEARKPKGVAEICEINGEVVAIEPTNDNKTAITVRGEEEARYVVPYGARLNVKVGDKVSKGDGLTKGPLNPHDILRLNGVGGVYQYLIKEVQRVYRQQGVDINDKHIEVIVSQMLSKIHVDDVGDTRLLPGGLYSLYEIRQANEALEEGQRPAVGERTLLGITKASLATSSFLSAASFQETTRVLTDAAIKGKTDNLLGLKENVIIGKLIPAGTGMKQYRSVAVDYGVNTEFMESFTREEEAPQPEEDYSGLEKIIAE